MAQFKPIEIPYEEETDLVHSPDHPFCGDPTCPCSEDATLIGELSNRVTSGELTPDEATDIVRGKGR